MYSLFSRSGGSLQGDATLCDFHDFGLTFFLHIVFLYFWKCQKMCFGWLHNLPQRLKSTFFEIFSSLHWPLQGCSVRKNFKKRWFYPLRQTVQCPAKMRPKLWKSHIVMWRPNRNICVVVVVVFFYPYPFCWRPRKSAATTPLLRRRALHTPHAHMRERDREKQQQKKPTRKGEQRNTPGLISRETKSS